MDTQLFIKNVSIVQQSASAVDKIYSVYVKQGKSNIIQSIKYQSDKIM